MTQYPPAACWQLRCRRLMLDSTPLLMGIINTTPDSFSDGGRYLAADEAVEQGMRLAAGGADLLDIGGESTRPYAEPVPADEELRRTIPVVQALANRVDIPISIDTSKSSVARAALAAGAEIINDVTGLRADPAMIELAVETGAGVCVMHMQGTPQSMQDAPHYDDVVAEVRAFLAERRDALVAAGVTLDRICLDPGIGFGKTHAHNWQLIRRIEALLSLGCPMLVGHSRKGFLAQWIGDKERDRTAATLGVSLALANRGVHILRLHEVQATREAWQAFRASVQERTLDFGGLRD